MEHRHELAGRGHDGITTASGASARTTCAARFARVLHETGLHSALGYLNERTRYRFTGLYRADAPLLRNIGLFDRENPNLDVSGAVTKLDDTYCGITTAGTVPFAVQDAPNDDRLVTHAARHSVLCYAGVPIRLASGQPWGTLCHFDLRPRLLASDELGALTTVAPVVVEWLSTRPGVE